METLIRNVQQTTIAVLDFVLIVVGHQQPK